MFLSYIQVWLSGWKALAERYPYHDDHPEGRLAPGTKVNGVGIIWLRVSVLPSGLLLFVRTLVGNSFPPILVPWSEIGEVKHWDIWGTARTSFRIGDPTAGKVVISSRWIKGSPFLKR
jgi:hypothetical protein